MTNILDLPSMRKRTHLLSIEEYHALGKLGYLSKKTELINGVVLNKIPKSPKHATMVKKLFHFFYKFLDTRFHVISEQSITLTHSEPEPDISIIKGKIEDFESSHPKTAGLIIEVSISNINEDRIMADVYAEGNIPEYWILNLNNNSIEVYKNPNQGRYSEMKTYDSESVINTQFSSEIEFKLSNLI